MAKHSLVGASSAARWMNCPGSVNLIQKTELPTEADSPWAAEGTAAHALAQECLEQGLSRVPVRKAGVTAEMRDAVDMYLTHVWNSVGRGDEYVLLVEHKFDLGVDNPRFEGCFGTCDAVIYNRTKKQLFLFDLKYGQGVIVRAVGNKQLLYYALGALNAFADEEINSIVLCIVQPRRPLEDESLPIDEWHTDMWTLYEFECDLEEALEEVKKPGAALVPGGWCQFCPVAAHCPALHRNALMVATGEFSDVSLEELSKPQVIALNSEELGKRLAQVAILNIAAKKLMDFAMREAERGRPPKGWTLAPKQPRRRWADEGNLAFHDDLEALMQDKHVEAFEVYSLRSPAQVEKAFGKTDFKQLSRYVEKVSSGLKLAPDAGLKNLLDAINIDFTGINNDDFKTAD